MHCPPKRNILFRICTFLLTVFAAFTSAYAQVPPLINFQAQLGETVSRPVSASFALYDSSENGTKLWEESYTDLDFEGGYLTVLLGANTPFPESLFTDPGLRYIEITVNGEILSPRLQLTSVSYALRAQTADNLLNPVVTSINGITDVMSLEAGNNIEIDRVGQALQISAVLPDSTNSAAGIQSVEAGTGILVVNPEGPSPRVFVQANSINDELVEDGSLSRTSLAEGAAVYSLNGVTDDVTLEGGNNIEVVQEGQTITINSNQPGEEGGINVINAGTGIVVSDANGPSTTISLADDSISDAQIKDNSITGTSLAPGTAVLDINGLSNQVTLAAGDNINIVQADQTLTINATNSGGGAGIQSLTGGTGITVSTPGGPTATVSIQNDAITDGQVADNSLTGNSLADASVGSSELVNQIVLGADGKLEIQNPSGAIRAALATSNGGGFLGIDTANDNDAVTLEALGGNAYGLITVHNLTGDVGVRAWGDQTASGLAGGSVALFKRDGTNSSIWLRTGGSGADNSWGIMGISDASGSEVITLSGENGDVSIAGNLSKGSGSFKIDHPLDPENKYLSHSFVESPDMMNIYNGNVTLDANGTAWVNLPEWFEALNADFRYQLTCIGGFAQVYIAEEVKDGRFQIAGGYPDLKVSWQVTGIRKDPFAEHNRIQVEEDKPEHKRGTYLHPNAYENH